MQTSLFYESKEDALREVVRALGGFQKAGYLLRPDKEADAAGRWLSDCLNTDRRDILNSEQETWLFREGRKIGCHAAMHFICQLYGYADAAPIDPEDEKAALQRGFMESVKRLSSMADRIERLQQHNS